MDIPARRMDTCGVRLKSDGSSLIDLRPDDTMCSDDPSTVIIKTEGVNRISDLVLSGGVGSVVVEAGVTFVQL